MRRLYTDLFSDTTKWTNLITQNKWLYYVKILCYMITVNKLKHCKYEITPTTQA